MIYDVSIENKNYRLELNRTTTGWTCNLKDGAGRQQGSSRLTAPMPGKVVRLLVNEKDQVEAGQGVVVVEAMKMQNEIKSPKKGIVQKLTAAEGTSVNAGDVLAIVE